MICALSRSYYFDNDKNLMNDVFWQQSKRVYFRFEWFIKFIKSNSIINLFFISVKWGNYLFFNTIPVLAVVVSFARHYPYVLFLSNIDNHFYSVSRVYIPFAIQISQVHVIEYHTYKGISFFPLTLS